MVTLMSHHQSARRERRQADTDAAATTSWFPAAGAALPLGVAGLATASSAITCLAISQSSSSDSDPPPAVDDPTSSHRRRYLLALSGLFYAGVAELVAAVWVMAEAEPRGRAAAGRIRLVHASLVPLTAAVGLLAATLFW